MAKQRDVLDSMAHDFSRFTTWMVSSLSLIMDRAGVRYGSSTKRSETLDADGAQRYSGTNIARRSQATEKVIVIDLFYLRGMDVDSVNIPYLLDRYLRIFALRRKHGR
ncbi:hypothetical protein Tco_1492186 [Tanacetum coccineum]